MREITLHIVVVCVLILDLIQLNMLFLALPKETNQNYEDYDHHCDCYYH